MKIKKTSWHYRFNKFYDNEPRVKMMSINFCSYVLMTVCNLLGFLFLVGLLLSMVLVPSCIIGSVLFSKIKYLVWGDNLIGDFWWMMAIGLICVLGPAYLVGFVFPKLFSWVKKNCVNQ